MRSMTSLLLALASVLAIAAAVRSTWSPCGLSMLSTITPIGERGRNNGWAASAAWFVAGAVLGGATLGAGAALLAAAVGVLDLRHVNAAGQPAGDRGLAPPRAIGQGDIRLGDAAFAKRALEMDEPPEA